MVESLISFPLTGYRKTLDLLALWSHNPYLWRGSFIPKWVLWRFLGCSSSTLGIWLWKATTLLFTPDLPSCQKEQTFLVPLFGLFNVVLGQDVSLRNLIIFFKRNSISHTVVSCSPAFRATALPQGTERRRKKKIIGKEKNNEKWPASTWEWRVPGEKQLFPVLHSQEHLGYGQGFSGAVSGVCKPNCLPTLQEGMKNTSFPFLSQL